ncbi:AAA family ATPase [Elizabethkingia anophelis]|nr:AAA family ATPase [Elizabethkingia anophelis]
MPNLEGLGLQNFRTFTKKENLEFAPITLITGTNNAGKSSVFKAIQFLVDNFKDGIVSETLDFKSMKHELGNLERVFNRVTMEVFKNSKIPNSQSMYSRLWDIDKKNDDQLIELPIFEQDEDLVFFFPIKFGNNREINANMEVRYELTQFIPKNGTKKDLVISHNIKNIAIVKNGEYLHWSNVIGLMNNYEDAPTWEISTSIDLKKIIQLIIDTPFIEIKQGIKPDENTEDYFTIDLFSRIEKYKDIFFDFPFSKNKKDGYEGFTEKLEKGKSLFSDYSEVTEDEKSKLSTIEQKIMTDLLQGRDNSQYKILDCFKTNNIIGFMGDGMERYIANAELKEKESEEIQENSEEKNLRNLFKNPYETTPNSQLFINLLRAIEEDFSDIVQKKIDSLNKIYFLPTTRGRNREWFIDEQNSEDIQIIRDFSAIYLKNYPQIENFVNFWIGNGEIDKLDKEGKQVQKGFKIGKELSVFRDETIGLTKIFLVNFDGTKTPLVDLGYGISQLLPIIMKIAIIAHKHQLPYEYDFDYQDGSHRQTIYFNSSTLLIEEPEANLHPSLQAKMAELFIDAASRFNIQFLIETHSEYLIYKFQEYIGQKIVSSKNVNMYYFNHPNDVRQGLKDKYISYVKIGEDGSIDYDKYFGKGFFDEQTNLKLSLLNIQRNRFIEDYETIRKELKESSKTIEDYDAKMEEITEKLATTTSGKDKLKKQFNKIKKEKKDKELEFQELIKRQEEKIDEYTAKTDYSKYLTEIETIVDRNKIDNSKTLQYLSTGKFLLSNLDEDADFAPVIIQYGRAVEFEMLKWMNDFKNTISLTNLNRWCDNTNYINKIRQLFTDLGLTLIDNNTNYEISTGKKVNILNLKNYMNVDPDKWKFGGLTQVFELLYYTSPTTNVAYNYNSVPLMVAFSNYLKSIWRDYDIAEGLFNTYRNILDLRNCAGHTYSDSVCTSDIIDKSTAENYVAKVEAIFSCL